LKRLRPFVLQTEAVLRQGVLGFKAVPNEGNVEQISEVRCRESGREKGWFRRGNMGEGLFFSHTKRILRCDDDT